MLSIQKFFCLLALAGCSIVPLLVNSAVAQEIPELTERQKSVILLDARIDRIVEDAKKYEGFEGLENLPMEGPFEGIKVTDLKRVFASVSFPEDIQSVMAMAMVMRPPEKLPFDFFIRIEFNDAEQVEKFQSNIAADSKTVEIGGKEFFAADSGPSPAVAHRVNETTFEFGTPDYCLQEKREFFTDQIKAAYKAAPDEPVRLVIDLETRADLIRDVVDIGKQQMDNPVAVAYLELIDNAKTIVFTQSLASDTLATLMIEGANEADAQELKEGLEGLMGTAKIAMPALLANVRAAKVSEKTIGVLKTIVDDLEATIEGNNVSIVLEKPEGFVEAVNEIQIAVRKQAKAVSKLNNFRQMGLAALNYQSAFGEFPYNNEDTHKDLSWRVRVLPFLEENEIFDQLKTDQSPEDEANAKFADQMPSLFGSDKKNAGVSWIKSKVKSFGDITDGTSNTIMLIENPNAGPWLKNTPLTAEDAIQLVSNLKDGEQLVIVLYDCSTHKIENSIDKETLKNLLDPADGNAVNWP